MSHRLAKYIEQLLIQEACVVVPELGGFVLETIPAYWDEAQLLAYPPSVELHFQPALQHHDGLLESAYAKAYGISLRRGKLMMQEDVRTLRQSLIRHRRETLPGLGELELTEHGAMRFTPALSSLLSSSGYGLSPVSLPICVQGSVEQAEPAPSSTSYVQESESEDVWHLRIPKRGVAVASAAAVVILALLPWGNRIEPTNAFLAGVIPSFEPIRTADVRIQPSSTPISDTTVASPKATQAIEVQTPEAGRYYLIAASERKLERAEAFYQGLASDDNTYSELSLLKGRTIYWVSVASFDTQAEAYRQVQELAKQGLSVWVHKS